MTFADYASDIQTLYLSACQRRAPVLAPLNALSGHVPKRIAIVAPHPDDECLMAGYALRAKKQWGTTVCVIPYSYGSLLGRQAERKIELEKALSVLDFELLDERPAQSFHALALSEMKTALAASGADTVIVPHPLDGHPAHEACSKLVQAVARERQSETGLPLQILYSEFWQSMRDPDLLVPLDLESVIQMGEALLSHAGEMVRNPYHLTLPAWLMDQARRGAEISRGSAKTDLIFGQLYRVEKL